MKTDIKADGTLTIAPESELEAYALDQWCRANIDYRRVHPPFPKIIVDFNGFPGAMQAVKVPSTC